MSNVGTWMQRTAQDWLVLAELTRLGGGYVRPAMGARNK
jgi:hypothetical protein